MSLILILSKFCVCFGFIFKGWDVPCKNMARLDESEGFESLDRTKRLTRKERLCTDIDQAEKGCEDTDDGIEAAIPLMRDQDGDWVVHAQRTHYLTGQFRDLGVMCLMILCLVMCLVFYMICPQCLFGILIFSACLCPFFHPMNSPLWLAIVLLTVSGWSLTTGALSITWNNGFS